MDDFDIKLHDEIMKSLQFSDEEKKIMQSRFDKSKASELVMDKLSKINPLSENYYQVLDELSFINSDRCEHDRDVMGTCAACFDLEKKVVNLHPEVFKDDPYFADLFEDE